MNEQQEIRIGDLSVGNQRPFVLIGGVNVLEDWEIVARVAETFTTTADRLKVPYIFKASFDKANRSSVHSYRGPGVEDGMKLFERIKSEFGVLTITDMHEPWQAKAVADVVDVLQIPAFLARQTDLIKAAAETGKPINVKKPQFVAPDAMSNVVQKLKDFGNSNVILCERGTSFGYGNLIVDMLGIDIMKNMGWPVIFDVTHALQLPGGLGTATGGRSDQIIPLAMSGMAQGIAGLFLESHPNPAEAKCDGPSALALDRVPAFVERMKSLDDFVKSLDAKADTAPPAATPEVKAPRA